MTITKMLSTQLALSSKDKTSIDCSRSSDLLSVALSKSSFGSIIRLEGYTKICQLNKGGYIPKGEIQYEVFNCIRVNESKDTNLMAFIIRTVSPIKTTDKRAAP